MWGRTCIPRPVYQVLYPFKKHFRCAQAQHFLVFCWLAWAEPAVARRVVIGASVQGRPLVGWTFGPDRARHGNRRPSPVPGHFDRSLEALREKVHHAGEGD